MRFHGLISATLIVLLASRVQAAEVTGMMADPCAAGGMDWPNLCRFRAADAALTRAPHVVFIGDSITENWTRSDPAFFDAERLGRGISGQTSPQILLRFMQDVIALHPRLVHIMIGTNDVAGNTGPTGAVDYENNIVAMVQLAHANHVQVLLASIPPAGAFPWRPGIEPAATITMLNSWLRTYARKSGCHYVDYYAALADRNGSFQPQLADDGVHPNHDGYAVMEKVVMPALR
jgi:lysophospholipase L1-like esterase